MRIANVEHIYKKVFPKHDENHQRERYSDRADVENLSYIYKLK